MAPIVHHSSLRGEFVGVEDIVAGVRHFRGIKYGTIQHRYAKPNLFNDWGGARVDASQFGPRCPQNALDVYHLLRVPPKDRIQSQEKEDEFSCLNLNVTTPVKFGYHLLPAMIWVHGGSQVISYTSPANPICDPTKLVAMSALSDQPMIIVTFNYRLNIFAFGDGVGEKNLALQDQRLAIQWVVDHIADFGGDHDNITLAGESAGAVYVHAHLCMGVPVKRAIISSGSLYLSPPQPIERGRRLCATLSTKLQEFGDFDLATAPVPLLLKVLYENNINSLWLQAVPEFEDWDTKTASCQSVMVGDVEYESVIWRNGIEEMSSDSIAATFSGGEDISRLREMYGIFKDRSTSSKLGALDFINDLRFALPVELLAEHWTKCGKEVYQYLVDQPNPWQSSSRAHHAVDLVLLFAGFDLSFNPAAAEASGEMQHRWAAFVNGKTPWSTNTRFAFGPFGKCEEVNDEMFAARRRTRHMKMLQEIEGDKLKAIFSQLAGGRISLLN